MRYGAQHKRRTRERVLEQAAKAIRRAGPHRIGVADVMARAGLTHGGFYAHFASKDELVAAAIDHTFEQARARLERETQGRPAAHGLASYIDNYLTPEHRDARTRGCPLTFFANDVPRLSRAARERFARGVNDLVERLAAHLERLGQRDPETAASSMIAEMSGALTLARAEPSRQRSDAILARSRASIRRRLGLESRP